jgi:hypothetical protein
MRLVPGLRTVEGYIDGVQIGAWDCWEGQGLVLSHRDWIIARIADYVGPEAKSDTDDPRTRTQAALDTMVEHFFEEFPVTDQITVTDGKAPYHIT